MMSDFLITEKFAIVNPILDPEVRLKNAKICIINIASRLSFVEIIYNV